MTTIVTGAAGFIGMYLCRALLERGEDIIGVDSLNDYYDIKLKQARLDILNAYKGFRFCHANIADREAMMALAAPDITHIVNLAGYAGVLYSIENPYIYIEANVMGHLVMLELARRLPNLKHFVYASSSSVYGGNKKVPFAVGDTVDKPVSIYAATKCADELLSWNYAHIHKIPCTGLRFFTVYGPWGRPDMAPQIFSQRIFAGEPLKVYNHGNMQRDFTYIDDIIAGTLAAIEHVPVATVGSDGVAIPPHAVYNLGNAKVEQLMDFIATLEKTIGKKAICDFQPTPPGDVLITYADITSSTRDLGYVPQTDMQEGIAKLVEWYREYYRL